MRLAAVDVGTNTVRLLVADVHGSEPPVHIERRLQITRLGRAVDARRRLNADAMERTAGVVASFVERARRAAAERIVIAGTSALRDAANRSEFVDAVEARSGVTLRVLSGEEEGALGYLGATYGLGPGRYVVCDIGGGSTELIAGHETRETMCSLDLGSVRLTERCLANDPPLPEELERARSAIASHLDEAERALRPDPGATLVGVAGTVTTLAALVGGLDHYDPERVHGMRIAVTEIAGWSDRLARMPVADIRALGVVEPGRADVIAAGSMILRGIMERWGFSEVLVSERDVLDGLVLDAVSCAPELRGNPPVG